MRNNLLLCLLISVVLVACNEAGLSNNANEIRVELIDGTLRRTYIYEESISVDEFLRRVDANVSELDRVNPSRFTQIADGMTITIVRVTENIACVEQEYPFETRRLPTDALEPNVEEILQRGENGILQICERCIFENGTQTTCSETSRTVITEAKEQIIYYGTGGVDVPITIEGSLAYIAGGQAWVIKDNVRNRRPVTSDGGLDGRVFDLSPNGQQLLFTRFTENDTDPEFSNELWAILDIGAPEPVRLLPDNVLEGAWYPSESYTISYSTAEPRSGFPSWEAYNDMYVMRVDSQTGETVDFRDIVEVNARGIYSYWGTNYKWSPNGQSLAWSQADGVGLVDLETGEFITLTTFPHFDPAIAAGWVWQPELNWSKDSQLLTATLHGEPFGSEGDVNSVVFDIAVISPERNLVIEEVISRAGIWAQPQYSPIGQDAGGFPEYQMAYLQARDPLNSLGGEYDLYVADRDGSNPKKIFPPEGRQGIRPFNEAQPTEFIWSPSGRHIAIIYQGNLWIVELETLSTQQITTDGQASNPIWTN